MNFCIELIRGRSGKCRLCWILVYNVTKDVVKHISYCAPIPLPVHVLIQVASQLFPMTFSHPFDLYFNPIPIRLDVLCMHTGSNIHKLNGVVHCTVRRYI